MDKVPPDLLVVPAAIIVPLVTSFSILSGRKRKKESEAQRLAFFRRLRLLKNLAIGSTTPPIPNCVMANLLLRDLLICSNHEISI